MKDIKGVFRNLEKMLEQANWFDENWEIYNRGNYLQLYKVNWFNQKQGGVHFETFIEAQQTPLGPPNNASNTSPRPIHEAPVLISSNIAATKTAQDKINDLYLFFCNL